jgi:Dyp-type peroxidase family
MTNSLNKGDPQAEAYTPSSNPVTAGPLQHPLRWRTAQGDDLALLHDLQGNILKNHGRDASRHVFLHFKANQMHEVRQHLKSLAWLVTSAHQQFVESERHKRTGQSGLFVGLYLSAAGYRCLGFSEDQVPQDGPFRQGMKARGGDLGDPPFAAWDEAFQGEVHAMLLLAADSDLQPASDRLLAALPEAISVLGVEHGQPYRNGTGQAIEHFGYVDGRSQPLLLLEDWERERDAAGVNRWDPLSALSLALVHDPGGQGDSSCGSYLVFRKLEQNVRGFKEREQALADALGLGAGLPAGEDREAARELAGAMVIGRFEDGTPVLMHDRAQGETDVPNDFHYVTRDDKQDVLPALSADANGGRCPFHSHIRKTNPRGDAGTPGEERQHLMLRRGVTYGARTQNASGAFTDQPSQGVGLLFMAFQASVETQFEFTQRAWINNPNFPEHATGVDPVLGQVDAPVFGGLAAPGRTRPGCQRWPSTWGVAENGKTAFDFQGFVTLKGGEYFFAPSIGFLRNL